MELIYLGITAMICFTVYRICIKGVHIEVHHKHEHITQPIEHTEIDYEKLDSDLGKDKPATMDNVLSELNKLMLGDD